MQRQICDSKVRDAAKADLAAVEIAKGQKWKKRDLENGVGMYSLKVRCPAAPVVNEIYS